MQRKHVRTRLAPTPSGYLHIGNALSFAITAYLAQSTGAHTLLRIDDLDRERLQPAYVQDIFDTLRFLGIPWNEGPQDVSEYETTWSQMHRLGLYNAALEQLQAEGKVFACTCSRAQILRDSPDGTYPGTCRYKQLPLDTPDAAWRLYTDDTPLHVNDALATLPPTMRDFIVRKKDGFPAYQLSSLVDDGHFGVDLIVRGQDLWDATLAQQFLAKQLGATTFEKVTFYHHPLLLETSGEKLSKSAGATSIHYLRQHGHTATDVYRSIAAALQLKEADNWSSLAAQLLS